MSAERYTLCGCFYAETEDEARVLRKVIRSLGGAGFVIQHIVTNDDGSETRREITK